MLLIAISVLVTQRKNKKKRNDLFPCKNVWEEVRRPSRLFQGCVDGARPERS